MGVGDMQRNNDDQLIATVSITLRTDVTQTPDRAHVEGTVAVDGGDLVAFVGWLELMGLLERALLDHQQRSGQPTG
jgi:hypothetical protein